MNRVSGGRTARGERLEARGKSRKSILCFVCFSSAQSFTNLIVVHGNHYIELAIHSAHVAGIRGDGAEALVALRCENMCVLTLSEN